MAKVACAQAMERATLRLPSASVRSHSLVMYAKGSTVLASTNSERIAMDMDCVKWATASALQAGEWHLFA